MVQGTTRVERTATGAAIAVIAGFIRSQPSARASSALLDWAARDCPRQLATVGPGSGRASRDAPFSGLEGIDSKFRLIRCRLSLTAGRAYTIGPDSLKDRGSSGRRRSVSAPTESRRRSRVRLRGELSYCQAFSPAETSFGALDEPVSEPRIGGCAWWLQFTQNRRALIADRAGCYAVEPSGAAG